MREYTFGMMAVGDWFVWSGLHFEKTDARNATCLDDKVKSQLFWDQAVVVPFEEKKREESQAKGRSKKQKEAHEEGQQEVLSGDNTPAEGEQSTAGG